MSNNKLPFKTKEEFDELVRNIKIEINKQLKDQVSDITRTVINKHISSDSNYKSLIEALYSKVKSDIILELEKHILPDLQNANKFENYFITRSAISNACKDGMKVIPAFIDNKIYSENPEIAVFLKVFAMIIASFSSYLICPNENPPSMELDITSVPYEVDEL